MTFLHFVFLTMLCYLWLDLKSKATRHVWRFLPPCTQCCTKRQFLSTEESSRCLKIEIESKNLFTRVKYAANALNLANSKNGFTVTWLLQGYKDSVKCTDMQWWTCQRGLTFRKVIIDVIYFFQRVLFSLALFQLYSFHFSILKFKICGILFDWNRCEASFYNTINLFSFGRAVSILLLFAIFFAHARKNPRPFVVGE